MGYSDVKFIRPKYKDWNGILKAQSGIEPLHAVPNPYLENMRSLLNEAMETVSNTKYRLYPFKTLYDDYQRLTAAEYKIIAERCTNRFAVDALRMAKDCIKADEKELTRAFYEQYLPHTEKSCYANKLRNLENDMDTVSKLFGNPQIRIENDLHTNAIYLLRLACDSLKIQSHIDM